MSNRAFSNSTTWIRRKGSRIWFPRTCAGPGAEGRRSTDLVHSSSYGDCPTRCHDSKMRRIIIGDADAGIADIHHGPDGMASFVDKDAAAKLRYIGARPPGRAHSISPASTRCVSRSTIRHRLVRSAAADLTHRIEKRRHGPDVLSPFAKFKRTPMHVSEGAYDLMRGRSLAL